MSMEIEITETEVLELVEMAEQHLKKLREALPEHGIDCLQARTAVRGAVSVLKILEEDVCIHDGDDET